jgi:predicted phosphodiesterase
MMGGSMAVLSLGQSPAGASEPTPRRSVSVGIVADVHQDVIHDGPQRMQRFLEQMNQRKPDYLIQMGDFALPRKQNQPLLDIWNGFDGPRRHVLGNHDAEDGFTRQQTMDWWGMERRYYSFDVHGWHFIVLDGNDPNPRPWSGYNRYVAADQLAWLKEDLTSTANPTLIYCHQSLEKAKNGLANGPQLRQVLEQHNQDVGRTQVFACLSGHHHTDYVKTIADIHYLQINSMSYKWLGRGFKRVRFAPEIEKAHPRVSLTAPYRDPLFALMTLDPVAGALRIEGQRSTLVPPTPTELKVPHAAEIKATITSRVLKIG